MWYIVLGFHRFGRAFSWLEHQLTVANIYRSHFAPLIIFYHVYHEILVCAMSGNVWTCPDMSGNVRVLEKEYYFNVKYNAFIFQSDAYTILHVLIVLKLFKPGIVNGCRAGILYHVYLVLPSRIAVKVELLPMLAYYYVVRQF